MAGSSFNLMTAFVTLKERGVQTVMGSIGRIRNSTQRASKGFGGMGAAMSMALKVGARFTIIAGGLMAVGRAAKNLIGWLGRVSMQLATLASDAEETQNKFNATFGGQAEKAEEFVDRFSAAIGRSKTDVREGMSAYQAFFKGLDFGEKPATDLSITLQRLASDFGSFHNLSEQESMQRFISALSGSGEVLDRFGVNIKSAALDQQSAWIRLVSLWANFSYPVFPLAPGRGQSRTGAGKESPQNGIVPSSAGFGFTGCAGCE